MTNQVLRIRIDIEACKEPLTVDKPQYKLSEEDFGILQCYHEISFVEVLSSMSSNVILESLTGQLQKMNMMVREKILKFNQMRQADTLKKEDE